MMRFDKSTSNRASASQLGDKNGNFGQKNDFSALDHFFCTLCHFYILDFIFFFFSHQTHARLTFCCMVQISTVGGLLHEIADADPQNFSKSDIFHFAHSASGVLAKNIKRRFFKNRLQAKISYQLLKRNN